MVMGNTSVFRHQFSANYEVGRFIPAMTTVDSDIDHLAVTV